MTNFSSNPVNFSFQFDVLVERETPRSDSEADCMTQGVNFDVREGGTGLWLSNESFMTAFHLFTSLSGERKRGERDFFLRSVYKGQLKHSVRCRIMSYLQDVTESLDIVLVKVVSPITDYGIEAVEVNWLIDFESWSLLGGELSAYGFPVENLNTTVLDETPTLGARSPKRSRASQIAYNTFSVKIRSEHILASYGGLSGAGLYHTRMSLLVGVFLRDITPPSSDELTFECIEPSQLTDWWERLKQAVDYFRGGEDALMRFCYAEAGQLLQKSIDFFEETTIAPPSRLVDLSNLASAITAQNWSEAVDFLYKSWKPDLANQEELMSILKRRRDADIRLEKWWNRRSRFWCLLPTGIFRYRALRGYQRTNRPLADDCENRADRDEIEDRSVGGIGELRSDDERVVL